MSKVVILDTSILLNLLGVPGRSQDQEVVLQQFKHYIQEKAIFLMPLGVIFETGNHIAGINNSNQRRQFAKKLQDLAKKSLTGEAPFAPVPFPSHEQINSWLNEFPDRAMEKVGLVDLSIIKAWEKQCELNRSRTRNVLIWSMDNDLKRYTICPHSSRKSS